MQKLFLFFATFLVLEGWSQATSSVAKPTATDKRLALVIGNSAYTGKPLPNARNDAEDMAVTLRSLGFEVILKHNIGQEDFENTLSDFTTRLSSCAVGLFYFAGHGFEGSDNANYLMSVDIRDGLNETLAKKKSMSLTDIMNSMKEANNRTNILLVDACRNNPFRF